MSASHEWHKDGGQATMCGVAWSGSWGSPTSYLWCTAGASANIDCHFPRRHFGAASTFKPPQRCDINLWTASVVRHQPLRVLCGATSTIVPFLRCAFNIRATLAVLRPFLCHPCGATSDLTTALLIAVQAARVFHPLFLFCQTLRPFPVLLFVISVEMLDWSFS